ncbi:hypothetical protein [Vibrio sp. V39_P1S14PM300]|uniref:hypothetical protein n=1 Tax=Vibrio sp. V39_P1S14PM300 TaxID=1938690 RepID=UPI00137344C1|nr:hypothetical protein [Vibrio sp. V39_P1S14PM300]NAX23373.1 hypothetical protein [Vibrio sp. V39_P1S14PM300]
MDKQYWVVGAMWGGSDDALKDFIVRQYWYCWDINEAAESDSNVGNSIATQRERFSQIRSGDRIAVKRMLGRGSADMEVRALGVVRDVDFEEWRVYVNWLTDAQFARKVPLHGCTASIHGPFDSNDAWVQNVFCI